MSSIKQQSFYDEDEKALMREYHLKKQTYNRIFNYLFDYFEKNKLITVEIFAKYFHIIEKPRAHHLLGSFEILELIEKNKIAGRKYITFKQVNKDEWKELKKRLE